jgi:isochorismate synthase EntC
LLILVEDKKLKMEKISTIVNNVYKTHKYYIHSFLNTSAKYNLQISFDKFYIYERQDNEIYAIGCHHSLTFAIFKENNKSNSIFKTKIKSTLIENLCNN